MHDVHPLGSLLAARRIVSRLDLAFAETLLVCAGLKDISKISQSVGLLFNFNSANNNNVLRVLETDFSLKNEKSV